MELNKKIRLLQVRQGQGHSGSETVITDCTVWAEVLPPSASLKLKAEAASKAIDLVIYVWRHEFSKADYNRCEFQGKQYRFEADSAAMNDEFVKLLARRG